MPEDDDSKDRADRIADKLESINAPALARLTRIVGLSATAPTLGIVEDLTTLSEAAAELGRAVPDMAQMLEMNRHEDVVGIMGVSLMGAYWSGFRRCMTDLGMTRFHQQVEQLH